MSGGWVEDTLAQFGRQLGLPTFTLEPYGVAQLQLEAGGLLAIERARTPADDVLVYLGRPLGFDWAAVLRRAMRRAHSSSASPVQVQVAVQGDGPEGLLLMMVRIPEREFTPQTLSRSVEFLGRWSDEVRNA